MLASCSEFYFFPHLLCGRKTYPRKLINEILGRLILLFRLLVRRTGCAFPHPAWHWESPPTAGMQTSDCTLWSISSAGNQFCLVLRFRQCSLYCSRNCLHLHLCWDSRRTHKLRSFCSGNEEGCYCLTTLCFWSLHCSNCWISVNLPHRPRWSSS